MKPNIMNIKYVKKSIIYFCLILITLSANAQEDIAKKGNEAYKNFKYAEAINEYEKLLNKYESPSFYYNLGNAYYKGQDIASAVFYYEKALKWQPNNPDIKHNIEICNSKIIDRIENIPELFYIRWWKSLVNLFSPNVAAYLSLVLLCISLAFISLYMSNAKKNIKKTFFLSGIITSSLFALSMAIAAQRYYDVKEHSHAIVFDKQVNLKISPDENSKEIFTLHEGTKVKLLDEIANWQEVKISNGTTGWLKASSIKAI